MPGGNISFTSIQPQVMADVNIGKQRQIKLIEMLTVQNTDGSTTESTGNVYPLYATVTRTGGYKDYRRGLTQMDDGYLFRVRFNFGFTPTGNYSVSYNGNRHNVNSIEQDSEERFWWIIKTDSKHG